MRASGRSPFSLGGHTNGDDGMARPLTSSIFSSLRDLRGFSFDLDGTIWEGPKLLPGAAELVDGLA